MQTGEGLDGSSRNWFAIYTAPRHEKRVIQHLGCRHVESFLPLYKAERKWANGCRPVVDLPLFPSYAFVRIDRRERVRVLEVPGVVRFVSAGAQLLPVPESEIELLREGLRTRKITPHPFLVAGERVRVVRGAMVGVEGIVQRTKSGMRVVVTIDAIQKSVAIEVDSDDVEPVRAFRGPSASQPPLS